MEAGSATPRPVLVVGDVVTDLIVRLREPLVHGSDTRAAIDLRPGGSGANQAAWLAYLGLEVDFVGRVGTDPWSAYHLEQLRHAGVRPHLVRDPHRPSGVIVVLVDPDGERSMLTDRGANLGLRPDDLPANLFLPAAHLHLSGYTLFEPHTRPAALEALRLARERGMSVSVDPSSAALLRDVGPDRFLEWTRDLDLCFPNLDEGRLLSGRTDPLEVARTLCRRYREVALKLGPNGALWMGAAGAPLTGVADPATVVDTTGAGDAFAAGFLARWLAAASPGDALANGLRLASLAVEQVGARPPSRSI